MDNLKFALFSIVVLALVGLGGYWAIATIKSGTEFDASQKVQELQQTNDGLTKQVADLTSQLNTAQAQIASLTPISTSTPTTKPTSSKSTGISTTQPTTYKNQSLINALQKLITANVSMKLGSTGTRVGTVQNFLNVYNNTSNKIDNDYGASTQKAVAAFQTDQGLSADGQAGSSTFSQMISWLKQQG